MDDTHSLGRSSRCQDSRRQSMACTFGRLVYQTSVRRRGLLDHIPRVAEHLARGTGAPPAAACLAGLFAHAIISHTCQSTRLEGFQCLPGSTRYPSCSSSRARSTCSVRACVVGNGVLDRSMSSCEPRRQDEVSTYAAQHTLPDGMQPVPQMVSPGSQAPDWRISKRAGFSDTSGTISRRGMESPPRRARAVISLRRILAVITVVTGLEVG